MQSQGAEARGRDKKILFIRHAAAVDATAWKGNDLERPLTRDGIRRFRKVARRLVKWYPRPDRVFCSEAVRARATAALLCERWTSARPEPRAELNPGATPSAIRRLIRESATDRCMVLVGHEPDFSRTIAALTAAGALRVKLKKGGVAEVRWKPAGKAELRALLTPDHMG